MKTAYIDTSVISECHRQGITASELNEILKAKKLIPIIGIYPNFEIAKNILTDNPIRASKLYSFIRDLKPEYSRLREELYRLEINKLRTNKPVDYLLTGHSKTLILNKIVEHCNGEFGCKHETFLRERQKLLDKYREVWQPEVTKEISKKYNQNFNKFLTDYFLILKSEPKKIEWIRQLIFVTTETKIVLNGSELNKLLNHLIAYPALRSLIYVHLYLLFLTETNRVTPAEDRFTDGLIIIESSYCTTLISNDESFMRKHAKNINPYIETIALKELTASIS